MKAWIVATAAAVLLFAAMPVGAQPETEYKAPRSPDGEHPDLSGIWQALNEANYDLELHMARPAMQMREGPVVPVPASPILAFGAVGSVPGGLGVVVGGGKIPYTEAGLAKRDENRANWITSDPEIKCFLPGVPRATYMPHPFQIFHGENDIFFAYQYAGAVRDIFMDDVGPSPVDSWMGWSRGTWEGETLVVDVEGIHEDSWLDRAGNHHSYKLHVTERYTPTGPDHLWYEATITDEDTFTEPWTIAMPLYRRLEPNARLMDFKCVEFVEELLYGKWRREPLSRPPEPLAEGR